MINHLVRLIRGSSRLTVEILTEDDANLTERVEWLYPGWSIESSTIKLCLPKGNWYNDRY